jgi:hypothetical protein
MLQPLKDITKEPEKVQEITKEAVKAAQKELYQPAEKSEVNTDLLKSNMGDLYFELDFPNGKIVVSMSRCERQISAFKNMTADQKYKFIEQAAIFGASPFGAPADIYPVPIKVGSVTEYVPVIYFKKVIEKAAENPNYDGFESGVIVETKDGQLIERRGQVILSTDKLIGGWCKAHDKRLKEPVYRSVNIDEFERLDNNGVGVALWNQKDGKRAYMIEKIAISNCLGISARLPKFYIEEELPVLDILHDDVTSQKAISANNEQFFNE